MQEYQKEPKQSLLTVSGHLKTTVVLFVLIAATMAGCLGDEEDPGGSGTGTPGNPRGHEGLKLKPAEANDIELEFDAIEIVPEDDPEWDRPNTTRNDWLLLSTTMSGSGSVVVFEWQYPKEAVVSNSRTGGDVLALDFAIALEPMGQGGHLSEGIDWMLLAFYERLDEDEGWQTVLADYEYGTTIESTEWSVAGEPEVSVETPRSSPFLVRIPAGQDAGDKVYLVLAARGPAEPFAVGVRTLPQQAAGRETSPTGNWRDFTGLVEARDVKPFVPERVSEAEGLFLASYLEEGRQAQNDRVERSYDMELPNEAIPSETQAVVMPRSTQFSSSVDWGGWSTVDIRYSNSPSAGQWSASGSIHGHDANREVTAASQTPRVCQAMVEGSEGASLENAITNGATVTSETIRYQHFSANVQMEPITGYPLRSTLNC